MSDFPSPFVIAELAQGYEGHAYLGELLVRGAAAAGADAVKFQIVYAEDVAEPGYRYYDWYKQLEMPVDSWRTLRDLAHRGGLKFYADLSGCRALEVGRELSLDGAKIHAANFFNHDLVAQVLEAFPLVLVSTGGIYIEELEHFIARHRLEPTDRHVVFLFGFQAEPTTLDKNHLARLPELRRRLGCFEVGFMDHSDGAGPDSIHVSIMAQALGVRIFEKHLTLDRALRLEDHASALAPQAFAEYVQVLRRLTVALGNADPVLTEAEEAYRRRSLKKLVAAYAFPAGHVLREGDLLQRKLDGPGEGFCYDPDSTIGRRLGRAMTSGEPVREGDLT